MCPVPDLTVKTLSLLETTFGIVNSSRAGSQHKKEEDGKELTINGWSTEGEGKKQPMNWLENLGTSQQGDIEKAGKPPKAKARAEAEKVAEDGTSLHGTIVRESTTRCGKIVLKKKKLVLNGEEAGSPTMP